MSKKLIVLGISLLWIAVAAGLIISKQDIMRNGKSVLLETMPVDPRDFLRGDYIVLRYKISTLDLEKVESGEKYFDRNKRVYVKLQPQGKFWEAVSVHSSKPESGDGIYMKAKVQYCYNHKVTLLYGIENYFVPEGEGKDIEKNMRGDKSSVVVEAVVDKSGNAIIRNISVH